MGTVLEETLRYTLGYAGNCSSGKSLLMSNLIFLFHLCFPSRVMPVNLNPHSLPFSLQICSKNSSSASWQLVVTTSTRHLLIPDSFHCVFALKCSTVKVDSKCCCHDNMEASVASLWGWPTCECVLLMWYFTPLSELNSFWQIKQVYFPSSPPPWSKNIGRKYSKTHRSWKKKCV